MLLPPAHATMKRHPTKKQLPQVKNGREKLEAEVYYIMDGAIRFGFDKRNYSDVSCVVFDQQDRIRGGYVRRNLDGVYPQSGNRPFCWGYY